MEGLAELGLNIPVLLAQVISFGILFALLRLVAYKPMMRMLDERSRKIKESMENADSIKKQASLAEEETKKRIDAAAKEGQDMIVRAIKAGDDFKQQSQKEAKQEAEALIIRAQAEIKRERDEAIAQIRRQFGDLAIMAAEKVIERSLDKEKHQELISKVLDESTAEKK